MRIMRTCPFTGTIRTIQIDVTRDQIAAWRGGALIQVAMPNASASEREFIKTGIVNEEWDKMGGDE